MSDVGDFLDSSALKNEFEKCGLIILCHLFKRVVPIGLFVSIVIRVQISVMPAIAITSRIIHPNITSNVNQDKCKRYSAV